MKCWRQQSPHSTFLEDFSCAYPDYNNAPINVTFASGEVRKTIAIPVTDDSTFEPTETLGLTLTDPTNGAAIGSLATATLNILDNDAQPGTLAFSQADYVLNEDGTAAVAVTVERTGGSDRTVSATVSLSDGTATSGDDYVATHIVVTFAEGETSKVVTLPIIDDVVTEQAESINLSLSNATGGATLGSQVTAVAMIAANDLSPRLTVTLAEASATEGAGTLTGTVTRNTPTTEPLTVTLRSSDTSELTVPTTVTIPVGESVATFNVAVVDDAIVDANQTATLIATAAGFASGSDDIVIINDDALNLSLALAQPSINESGSNNSVVVTVSRNIVSNEALTVRLSASDTEAVTLPESVVITSGAASATFTVAAIDNALLDGNQPVTLTATPTDAESNQPLAAGVATTALEILDNESPGLSLQLNRDLIGETGTATATVTRNGDTTAALTVNLASSDTGEATVPGSVVIAAGESAATFTVSGVADGAADGSQPVTITATATGINADIATVEVTDVPIPDLVVAELAPTATSLTDEQAQLTYKVENRGLQNISGTWKDRVYLSEDGQLDAGDELISEVEISPNNLQVGQGYERTISYFNPRTPGDYYLIATVDADNSVDEGAGQGESNNSIIVPFEVLSAYSAKVETDVEVGVPGESIVLRGRATSNEDGTAVPFEFVTIEVENNGFTREIDGFTDANGNFVRAFTPLAGEAGAYNIRAYFPGNPAEDAGFEDSFKVLGAQFEQSQANYRIVADTPFTASASLENLTDTDLTGFSASVESLPDNWDVQVSVPTDLAGSATNTIDYTITAPTDSLITQDRFNINLTSAEGVTAILPVNVNLERIVPRLTADVGRLTSGMLRGSQTTVEVELTNEGGASAENIQVLLPDAPWLSLATTDTIESLDPGASTNVSFLLTPDENLDLSNYDGSVIFDAAGNDGDLSLPFQFRAVSEGVGNLQVNVVNELFYFAEGAPKLDDATVVIRDYFTQEEVARVTTDESGMVDFSGLTEGYYVLEVRAEDHDTFRQNIQINAGENEVVNSFLSKQTVKYTWTVTETEIKDRYNIAVESTFETDVPIPTVTVDPPSLDFADLQVVGQVMQIDMTVTNHGLIAAEDVGLAFGSHPFYKIEPLIEGVDTLEAKSSLTIPVRVTRVADFETLGASSGEFSLSADEPLIPCGIAAAVDYCYECGDEFICRRGTLYIGNVEGNCPDLGSSLVEVRPAPESSAGGRGFVRNNPVNVDTSLCNGECNIPDVQLSVDAKEYVEPFAEWGEDLFNSFLKGRVEAAVDVENADASVKLCCDDASLLGVGLEFTAQTGAQASLSIGPALEFDFDKKDLEFSTPGGLLKEVEIDGTGFLGIRCQLHWRLDDSYKIIRSPLGI